MLWCSYPQVQLIVLQQIMRRMGPCKSLCEATSEHSMKILSPTALDE
ncbi:hypothetical protein CGMCC3_g16280 [Colletotrichum fructicola]|nr:uncharacterized protein CGMCC3_g16280 [Colletotrichum fructicola]KAE9567599.1 hypothetical protein CGMCC3_g16280 [Colletotrichum fructicola]